MLEYSILILLFSINIDGLKWKSTGYGKNIDNIISLISTNNGPMIDVFDGKQVIILKDIDIYKYSITIYCYAVGYGNNTIEYKFCKNKICVKSDEKHNNKEFNIIQSKGIQINITFEKNDKDYSGNYYCQANDKLNYFSIQSNFIQIRDKYYWQQHFVQNPLNETTNHTKEFFKEDLPIKFPCFTNNTQFSGKRPKWMFQEFSSPVKWSVCPVKSHETNLMDKTTFTSCRDYTTKQWPYNDKTIMPRRLKEMKNKWNYYVNNNGELILFDFRKSGNISYALMCYTKLDNIVRPINTYVGEFKGDYILKGVIFSNSKRADQSTPTSSLLHQNIIIPARTKKQLNIAEDSLFAVYFNYSFLSVSNYKWFFNNREIQNDDNFDIDEFKVLFLNEIKSDKEGNYSLLDVGKNEKYTITVTVDGPPSLIETSCLPSINYFWEKSDMTIKCSFNYRPNHLFIKISSLKLKEDTNKECIEIEQIPIIKKSENVVLIHNSNSLNITSDHSITFIASNNYGSFARSSMIYILPKLESQIYDFPSDFSCNKPCSNSESHRIFCRINKDEYLKKELDVNISWIINGREPRSMYYQKVFAKYFLLDPISNDLIMKSNTSKDNCGQSLKEFHIECRIILKYNDKSVSRFFYNSSADQSLQERLTAIIKFDDPKPMSSLWILPILLFLIFISGIIFIILFKKFRKKNYKVTFSKMRNWSRSEI